MSTFDILRVVTGPLLIAAIITIFIAYRYPKWFAVRYRYARRRLMKPFSRFRSQHSASSNPDKKAEKKSDGGIPKIQWILIVTKVASVTFILLYGDFILSAETASAITEVFSALVGTTLALFLVLFIAGPFAAPLLTNNPNANKPKDWKWDPDTKAIYPKSTFGFFTTLEPGRIKITVIGESFVAALMAWSKRKFLGERKDNELQPGDDEYTTIVDTDGYPESHPIPFPGFKPRWWWFTYCELSILWWIWKRFVFSTTGCIFTGIYPFKTVRVMRLEYFRIHQDKKGDVTLEQVVNYSDHLRAAQFDLVILVSSAETSDLLAAKMLIVVVGRVVNPYLAAFNSNGDWSGRVTSAVSDIMLEFAKTRKLDEVIAAKDGKRARELESLILTRSEPHVYKSMKPKTPLADIGTTIDRVQVIDISVADPEAAKRVAAAAFADAERKAAILTAEGEKQALILRGEGLADQVAKTGQALKDHPEGAVLAEIEGRVRSAQAMKDGILVLSDGKKVDAMNVAILKELREQRQNKGSNP